MVSNASLLSSLHPEANKMDDIDRQLQQLEEGEKEENLTQQSSKTVFTNLPTALIDIDNEQQNEIISSAPLEVEAHTNAKTIDSSVINQGHQNQPEEKVIITMPCILCDVNIECSQHKDGSGQMHEMVDHLEKVHKQKMCPVCSTLFDTRLPIFKTYFANHIQNHFNNIKYPSLNSSDNNNNNNFK